MMKNNYKLLNSSDDDVENNIDSNSIKSNQIEMVEIIPTTESNNSSKNNSNENNSNENNSIKNDLINHIIPCILSMMCIIMMFGIFISVIVILDVIFKPSNLNYCDNNYKKCEYYQTDGLLVNNSLIEKYYNFNIEYVLVSSYEYIPYSHNYNHRNNFSYEYICKNMEIHKFDSFDEAYKVSDKSLGTVKKIFVPYDNKITKCLTTFHFYNPRRFKLNIFAFVNIFILTFGGIWLMAFYDFIKKSNNLTESNQCVKKILAKIVSFITWVFCPIFMIIWFFSSLCVIYYLYK